VPIVLASCHSSRSYASIRGMEEPEGDLEEDIFQFLARFEAWRSWLESLGREKWRRIIE
jgi:hypothetical protein